MKKTLVDLHIHSHASDGTDSPAQLIDIALAKDIKVISLTDHCVIDNSIEFQELAKKNDLLSISGCEVNAKIGRMTYHILALGVDLYNSEFEKYIKNVRQSMLDNNRELIEKMSNDYKELILEEFDEYIYERTNGGWNSINYLLEKNITTNLREGSKYYEIYDCSYADVSFPSPREVADAIHKAGGYAILAHPSQYFTGKNPTVNEINQLYTVTKNQGLDGIECYYPFNTEVTTGEGLKFCNKHNLMITGGCDYHGGFLPDTRMGKIEITTDMLTIEKLL